MSTESLINSYIDTLPVDLLDVVVADGCLKYLAKRYSIDIREPRIADIFGNLLFIASGKSAARLSAGLDAVEVLDALIQAPEASHAH